MNIFIAEDEAPARERLIDSLGRVAPQARIVGTAPTVQQTAAWLAANPPPDLLLLDIQLADGLSLELFKHGALSCPTIFTTAYDEYVLQAFQAQAIDYLLKPVDEAKLAQALAKWAQLRRHFTAGLFEALQGLRGEPRFRTRLLARQGARHVVLPVDRVAYLLSVDKLCVAVTCDGERYLLDEPLGEVEQWLDPAHFHRLNRQVLASVPAVLGFRSAGKGRLEVDLQPPADDAVIVSQERAAAFKDWLAR